MARRTTYREGEQFLGEGAVREALKKRESLGRFLVVIPPVAATSGTDEPPPEAIHENHYLGSKYVSVWANDLSLQTSIVPTLFAGTIAATGSPRMPVPSSNRQIICICVALVPRVERVIGRSQSCLTCYSPSYLAASEGSGRIGSPRRQGMTRIHTWYG